MEFSGESEARGGSEESNRRNSGKEWIVKRIFSPEEVPICPEEKVPICPEEKVPICPEEKVLKKVFLKQEKDEIAEWDGNLVEIFSRLEKISAQIQGMKK